MVGSMHKYKAGLVAKGYSQRLGMDFEELFSHVAKMETVRAFLTIAMQLKWPVYQLDVKLAFHNGKLQEEVHISQLDVDMARKSMNPFQAPIGPVTRL